MCSDEKKPPEGGAAEEFGMYRKGAHDHGIFRVGYVAPDGVGYPMFFSRFETMKMDARAQRVTLSFSG